MRERSLADVAADDLERQGFRVSRQPAIGETAWKPDLLATRAGDTWFVEVKATGASVSPSQLREWILLAEERGARVAVWQGTLDHRLTASHGDLHPRSPIDGRRASLMHWIDVCQRAEGELRLIAAANEYLDRLDHERDASTREFPFRRDYDPHASWPGLLTGLASIGSVSPDDLMVFSDHLAARDAVLATGDPKWTPSTVEAARLGTAIETTRALAYELGLFPS